MLKKLFFAITLFSGIAASVHAQDFTISKDPVDDTTAGSDEAAILTTTCTNITTSDLSVSWVVIDKFIPSGWSFTGVCDNITCYSDTPTLNGTTSRTSDAVTANGSFQFMVDIIAPASAMNGTATVRLKASTLGQTDTILFRLTKIGTTSVSSISLNDSRVSLSPNPVRSALNVYAEKNLEAEKIRIVNLMGQTILTKAVNKSADITNIDVNTLAKGTYIVTISNNKGQVVTSRKFIKD